MTPEIQSKILLYRSKAADGTLTPEDMREAIIALREGRQNAAKAAGATKAASPRAIKSIPSADDLLKEMGI